MDIEQIEDWKGQNVVDSDGEKIGKLEDVYFEEGSRDAVFGCVKSGLLGRRHLLVPLADASVSRDHVRVAYRQDRVKEGPQVEPGATLESGTEQELARHYELELTGARRYESASARAEREARAREATARAEELETLAKRKAAEAREGEQLADDTRRQAQQAQDERDRALREAAEARAEARTERPPSP